MGSKWNQLIDIHVLLRATHGIKMNSEKQKISGSTDSQILRRSGCVLNPGKSRDQELQKRVVKQSRTIFASQDSIH